MSPASLILLRLVGSDDPRYDPKIDEVMSIQVSVEETKHFPFIPPLSSPSLVLLPAGDWETIKSQNNSTSGLSQVSPWKNFARLSLREGVYVESLNVYGVTLKSMEQVLTSDKNHASWTVDEISSWVKGKILLFRQCSSLLSQTRSSSSTSEISCPLLCSALTSSSIPAEYGGLVLFTVADKDLASSKEFELSWPEIIQSLRCEGEYGIYLPRSGQERRRSRLFNLSSASPTLFYLFYDDFRRCALDSSFLPEIISQITTWTSGFNIPQWIDSQRADLTGKKRLVKSGSLSSPSSSLTHSQPSTQCLSGINALHLSFTDTVKRTESIYDAGLDQEKTVVLVFLEIADSDVAKKIIKNWGLAENSHTVNPMLPVSGVAFIRHTFPTFVSYQGICHKDLRYCALDELPKFILMTRLDWDSCRANRKYHIERCEAYGGHVVDCYERNSYIDSFAQFRSWLETTVPSFLSLAQEQKMANSTGSLHLSGISALAASPKSPQLHIRTLQESTSTEGSANVLHGQKIKMTFTISFE